MTNHMNRIGRRAVLAWAALSLLALSPAGHALAADHPERTITGIVPFTTGGGSDLTARLFASHMAEALGKPVIVENKPGAGGNLGIGVFTQAKADGYTILFCSTAITQNPPLYKTLGWNPDDLQAVAYMGISDQMLVVNIAKHPDITTLQELVAYMNKNPGKLNYSSQDSGLTANLFRTASNTKFEIINYPGGGDSALAVMNGETDVSSMNYASAMAGLNAGKTRAIAVTGPKRLPQLPNTPTTVEAGLPGFIPQSYFGVFVRKGTPQPIVDRLNAVVNKVAQIPEVTAKLESLGFRPVQETPDAFQKFITSDTDRWRKVVAESGIKTLD